MIDILGFMKPSFRWPRLMVAISTVLFFVACKEDWSSRIGARSLYKSVLSPFPAYPVEQFRNTLSLDPPSFSFVVLGGTCFERDNLTAADASTVYDQVVSKISTITPLPRFIFHVGDIASGAGDREAWKLWIRKSYPFQVPEDEQDLLDPRKVHLLTLPGDRDLLSKDEEEAFLRQFPFGTSRIYYSFDLDGFHFVALNSETVDQGPLMRWFGWNRYRNRITDEQLAWLKGDLESNKNKPIVVFVHKPLFPPVFSRHEGYCLDQYYFDRERLLRLFNQYSVKAVFSGHEPIFYCSEIEGVLHFISSGAGRETSRYRALGGFHHFLYVAVHGQDRMVVYAIDVETDSVEFECSVEIGSRAGNLVKEKGRILHPNLPPEKQFRQNAL